MPKFYFSDLEDSSYHLSYWKEYMKDNLLTEIKLFEAKVDFGNGYFYCQELGILDEVGNEWCGKLCRSYKPRNGKNGRCRHSGHTYDQTDKVKILTNSK